MSARAELVVEQLGLQGANGLDVPGVDCTDDDDAGADLGPEQAKENRAIAASCDYLSADRPDIQFPPTRPAEK